MEWKSKLKQTNTVLLLLGILLLAGAVLLISGKGKKIFFPEKNVLSVGVFSDSYWEVQNGYSYRILEDAIAKFEKTYDADITVTYVSGIMKEDYSEWLAEQMVMGTAPDLFFVPGDDLYEFAGAGALLDLTDLMAGDAQMEEIDYYTSALQAGIYEGRTYALPYECAPRLMFVNKTILNDEGIDLPGQNWTFDDFYTICRRVTKDTDGDGVIDRFGVTGYTYEDAFSANDVQLFDSEKRECYFTGNKVLETLSLLEKLNELNEGYTVSEHEFDVGNVAFMPMSFSEYRAYKSYPLSVKKYTGFEWECLPMPAGPSGDNVSELDILLLAINRESSNPDAAFAFMKMLTGDAEIQSEIFDYSEGVSVLRSVTESEQTLALLLEGEGAGSFRLNTLSSAVEQAVTIQRFDSYDEIMTEVDTAVRDILEGSENISTGQIIWNRKLNSMLKEETR